MIPILIAGPAIEPISLEEAKAWLRLDGSEDDQLLSALIVSARLTLEAYTRRFFVTQSWRLTLDEWPKTMLHKKIFSIPFAPLQTVSAIRVYGASGVSQMLAPGSYDARPAPDRGRVTFLEAPPAPERGTDGIEIDVIVGYGGQANDTPEPLRRAILMLVAQWHENRGDRLADQSRLPSLVGVLASPFRRERLQ